MIFNIFLSLLFFGLSAQAQDNPYSMPESAYFYAKEKVYFVSNINGDEDGWISKVNSKGEVIESKWADNLERPMGMRVLGNRLWVNNKGEVVGVKLDDPKDRVVYPVDGAVILNDLATDESSNSAYLSDSMNNRIVKINLLTGETEVFMDTSPSSPNGLLVVRGMLLVASWGVMSDDPEEKKQWKTKSLGSLYYVFLDDEKRQKRVLLEELGHLDGIEIDSKDNVYVSDWMTGKLYKVSRKKVELLGVFGQGLADIALDPQTGTVAMPAMLSNQLMFLY